MLKKIFFGSFLLFSLIGVFYPTNKENTKPFNYCYSLEKIISRNAIKKRKNLSSNLKSISSYIGKLGVNKTGGSLINKMIDEYKTSRDSFFIYLLPNKVYCFGGYWIEEVNPGMFESILFERSKKIIKDLKDSKDLKDLKDLKEELDSVIIDFNSEYKTIRDELFKAF